MVIIMMKQYKYKRIVSALLAAFLMSLLIVPMTPHASAADRRFITELRVEAGEDAVNKLEKDGWSVTMVGLNVTADSENQVYLAYKFNTGSPITNVIVSSDVGDTYTDKDGISYKCVSHVDVDKGIGGGAGCLYATSDKRAGKPLVGLDVLRGNSKDENVMYPITNDGAEIVRTSKGTPADLERASKTDVVYLAQIRDGIVRPYISEIGVVTDKDKWNAIYTACERGYNYYVEGDIDDSSDTYTIIAYERTVEPKEALTNITAIPADTVKSLEDEQKSNKSAKAISISDIEYVRISSKPIKAENDYYIYQTKDSKAGNPISMLYVETLKEAQNFLFGTWANAYFFSPGVTTAYTYSMNEDLYTTLWEDKTVCTKLPVQLLGSITSKKTTEKAIEVATDKTATPDEAATEKKTETKDKDEFINLTMLTPRDGLPDSKARLKGLLDDPKAPYVERTQRSDRVNKYQASIFGNSGLIVLIPLAVIIVVGAAVYIIKRKKKNASDKSKDSR